MADFDVIVVGAGCAGSVTACLLAREGKSVLMVERGADAGAKNMTGGRIYTHSLAELFPDFEKEAPLERRIVSENISLITGDESTTISFSSPQLGRPENSSYSVLRRPFDKWLASKAEEEGVECIFGVTVEELVLADDGRILGIKAGDDEITAEITILADGVNSLLTEGAHLASCPKSHQIAIGVKETLELPEGVISDRFQVAPGEGAAWLFAGAATQGHVGGGFLYTNRDSLSIGLVATLSDLCTATVPIYQMMEDFKQHPVIAPLVKDGKLIEYSGHLLPEGGYSMLPTLFADGCLVVGDAAMLCVNLGYQVRGMDYAIASGIIAAQTAQEALSIGDTSAAKLSAYRTKLEKSFVLKDMQAYQGFPAVMESTPRIFRGYPEMAAGIMKSLFIVDGSPVRPIRKKVMEPVKQVGMLNLLKDVRRGIKAL